MKRLDARRENSTEEQRLLARGLNTRRRQVDQIDIRVQDKEGLEREDSKAKTSLSDLRISTEARSGLRRDNRTSGQTDDISTYFGTCCRYTACVNTSWMWTAHFFMHHLMKMCLWNRHCTWILNPDIAWGCWRVCLDWSKHPETGT